MANPPLSRQAVAHAVGRRGRVIADAPIPSGNSVIEDLNPWLEPAVGEIDRVPVRRPIARCIGRSSEGHICARVDTVLRNPVRVSESGP